jgi:hypothetical protein
MKCKCNSMSVLCLNPGKFGAKFHCMRSVLMLCINDMVGFGKRLCHMKYALNCLNTFSSNFVMQEFKEEARGRTNGSEQPNC